MTPGRSSASIDVEDVGQDPAGARAWISISAGRLMVTRRAAHRVAIRRCPARRTMRDRIASVTRVDRLGAVEAVDDAGVARSGRRPRASAAPGARGARARPRADRRRAGAGACRPVADARLARRVGDPRGTACRRSGRSSGRRRAARARRSGPRSRSRGGCARPGRASVSSRAWAWPTVRGKPSRIAPRAAIGLASSSMNMRDRGLVGNELAALHVAARLLAERRAGRHGGAEQVARGEVREPELAGQDRGLGSLAGADRADEQEDQPLVVDPRVGRGRVGHRMKPS